MPLVTLSKAEFLCSTFEPPWIVLKEILESYRWPDPVGQNRESALVRIRILSKTVIVWPFSEDDWQILAQFINPSLDWTPDSLLRAFEFLEQAKDPEFRLRLSIGASTRIGRPTPECPTALSPSVLYAILCDRGLPVDPDSTLLDMYLTLYFSMNPSGEPGFVPGIATATRQTETTCTLEPLSSLDPTDCVAYGAPGGLYEIYTFDEIETGLKQYRRLSLPSGRDLTPTDVKTLKSLSPPSLLQTITDLENILSAQFDKCLQFKQLYLNSNSETKSKIRETLLRIHELSMTMRGWDGSGRLPIVETQGPNDVQITLAFLKLDHCLEDSDARVVTSLPLMRHERAGWRMASVPEGGLTIADRLQLVKTGDSANSCVRISSNWLASSAWYYMYLLDLDVSYSISDLVSIT